MSQELRFGIIGVGGIAGYVHRPGIGTVPGGRLVAFTDNYQDLLARRSREWGVRTHSDATELLAQDDVDAVIVSTPNYLHAPYAIEVANAGRHVLVEKPIAMNHPEAKTMLAAAQENDVRHMTAFTYRFVPAMRYLKHVVDKGDLGTPRHFRAQRFQEFSDHSVGWRQWKKTAGTGELGDMASHRIDFGHHLIGPIANVCGAFKQFELRDQDGHGNPVEPSDTDDWTAFIAEFESGVTGVWESTKLAKGYGSGGGSHDFCEVNGTEGSAIYELKHPYRILLGRKGETIEEVPVPDEFMKVEGSTRTAGEGDPRAVWRYDQAVEFSNAIREGRDCSPSFADGANCQAVMDAVLKAIDERRWVGVEY